MNLVRKLLITILTMLIVISSSPVYAANTLYEKFANTYGINIVGTDTSALQNRLNTLYSNYTQAKEINTIAATSENMERLVAQLNEDLKNKTTAELNNLDVLKKSTSKLIEESVLSTDLNQLTTLVAQYRDYEQQTKRVLEERNSIFKLFGSTKAEYVDLEPMEKEIMQYKSSIDEASKSAVNLGVLSELKRPFNYQVDISDYAGYRVHPIWGDVRFHSGMDYAMPTGTELYSMFNGTVLSSGWYGGYGNCVRIDCGDGIVLLYGHMDSVSVKEGQFVGQNELIGYSGSTGDSTGPHLHLGLFYQEEILSAEDLFK